MYGNNQQPPGSGGLPNPAPPVGGFHPNSEAGAPYQQPAQQHPNYNQPPPTYATAAAAGASPMAPQFAQQWPQQPMAYPAQSYAMQQNLNQPGMSTATTAQPHQQYAVVVQQQRMDKPKNCMVLAILVTIFCNCPLGTLAWIFSCLSDTAFNEGNQDKARTHGRISMVLSLFSCLIGVILCIAIPILILNSARICSVGRNYYGTSGCFFCSECCTGFLGDCTDGQKLICKDTCYRI